MVVSPRALPSAISLNCRTADGRHGDDGEESTESEAEAIALWWLVHVDYSDSLFPIFFSGTHDSCGE